MNELNPRKTSLNPKQLLPLNVIRILNLRDMENNAEYEHNKGSFEQFQERYMS